MIYTASMNFDDYQKKAMTTAITSGSGLPVLATRSLGLGGEAGEVQELIKKAIRDNEGVLPDEKLPALKKELGDVLWYVAAIADFYDLSMQDIAKTNIDKLCSRKKRGTLSGSGNDR